MYVMRQCKKLRLCLIKRQTYEDVWVIGGKVPCSLNLNLNIGQLSAAGKVLSVGEF
jgi:hypothetical protein